MNLAVATLTTFCRSHTTRWALFSVVTADSFLLVCFIQARGSHASLPAHQLEKLQKAASAAHTYFVANPSHLEMRNNIEKYRRMEGVTEEAFQDREIGNEKHWVRVPVMSRGIKVALGTLMSFVFVERNILPVWLWGNKLQLEGLIPLSHLQWLHHGIQFLYTFKLVYSR